VSLFAIVLLVAAAVLLGAVEWHRVAGLGHARAQRTRAQRKLRLRVVEQHPDIDEEFARSVERDLAALPTIDERDAKR
jgi:hypothetical protein